MQDALLILRVIAGLGWAGSEDHELSKIPTIPAEIRTSPLPICSLLRVVSNATASTSPDSRSTEDVAGRHSLNMGGKVNGSNWIVSDARSTRRQGG
jgi:hypothetical protein